MGIRDSHRGIPFLPEDEPPQNSLARRPANGTYRGKARVREVPTGTYGEDLSGNPKRYVFHKSLKSRLMPKAKDACPNGHARTPENTKPHDSGRGVTCMVCARIRAKKYRDADRAARRAKRAT